MRTGAWSASSSGTPRTRSRRSRPAGSRRPDARRACWSCMSAGPQASRRCGGRAKSVAVLDNEVLSLVGQEAKEPHRGTPPPVPHTSVSRRWRGASSLWIGAGIPAASRRASSATRSPSSSPASSASPSGSRIAARRPASTARTRSTLAAHLALELLRRHLDLADRRSNSALRLMQSVEEDTSSRHARGFAVSPPNAGL